MRAFGLNFPNPVGIAAGFDKNAEVPDALLRLGFGFVEVGTVTPLPQAGNPRPRLFRLEADEAVINRLGFNSEGAAAVLARLAARARRGRHRRRQYRRQPGFSADRAADYVRLIETFAPVASYFTVNVSSPNTPGLRDLQQATALDDLLARVVEARDRVRAARRADAGAAQDRARSFARRSRRRGRRRAQAPRRRHDRRQHHDRAAGVAARARQGAARRAGCPAGRCSRCRRACWRRPIVRAEGAFPLIGVGGINSGAAAHRQDQGRRRLWCSSTPGWSIRGLGLVAEIKADAAGGARARRPQIRSSDWSASDAAAMTAESWPA